MNTVTWAMALGIVAGIGVVTCVVAARPGLASAASAPLADDNDASRPAGRTSQWIIHHRWRLLAAAAVAAAVWWWTRWPVGALAAGCLMWAAPAILGPDTAHARQLAKMEAVAAWTESLRDVLSAAAGLEQAVCATADHAPPAIAADVTALAQSVRSHTPLPVALRRFAQRVDDEICDLVVVSLSMAVQRQASQLAPLLGTLADAARAQAALRMRVAASRARIRTATRVITTVVMVMVAGLLVLSADFLAPYSTIDGQLALLAIAGLFTTGLHWLHRMSAVAGPPRLLAADDKETT